jgi:hypothetical protein
VVDGFERCTQKLAARECGMPLKDTIPASGLSQWVIFRAQLAGASRLRVSADAIVRNFGYKPAERGQADQTITAMRLITDICSKDQGTKVLADALYIYSSTWPVVSAKSRILEALVRYLSDEDASAVVRRHGLDYAVMRLSRFTLSGLHNYVSTYAAQHDLTESSSYLSAVTKAIGKRYYKD